VKIDSVLNNISNLKQRLSEVALQNLLAIKGILTQQQVEKLANLQQRMPGELRGIQLTSDQRSQVRELMKNSRQKNRAIADELHELKAELRETLLASDNLDPEQLKQLQADIAEKELALEKARVDNVLQIREVLTPEQWKQLKQFRAKRQKNMPSK
jgi:Spy/CpxP family protein refolding chaperone